MKKFKKLAFLATTVFLVTVLIGCSQKGDKRASKNNNSNENSVTMTDTLGNKVSIPKNPKRVIASYLEDHLVALGIKPIAQWSVKGDNIQDYLQDDLKKIPTIPYDLPVETVMKFDPDLLLIGSSDTVEGGKYSQYSKVVPTYVVKNGEDVNWRDQLLEIGRVLKEENKAKKVLSDYDNKVKEVKEKISKLDKKPSAIVIWVTEGSIFMVREDKSSGGLLYGELGIESPKLVKEVTKIATSDWSSVSLEKLAEVDTDHIFLINSDKGKSIFEDGLWQNIPAVKNGNVHEYGPETSWLYTGAIAYKEIIDDVEESLLK